jgi:hypothetical protein
MRVRDRRPGTVSRSADPVGSGFYLFCGVRWLDPDDPADAILIADGLARLEADFPHLRGGTTLKQICAVIRIKRLTWEEHLRAGQSTATKECQAKAAYYPVDTDFQLADASSPPRRRPRPALNGACLPRHPPAARVWQTVPSGPGASAARPPVAFRVAGPPPPLPHPQRSGSPWPDPALPYPSHSGNPWPDPGPPRHAAEPLPALPRIDCASWADPPHAPLAAPFPGPDSDSPWAWYPAALPPTPPPPAAGVRPPANWPSPPPPARPAGRGARRPRGG